MYAGLSSKHSFQRSILSFFISNIRSSPYLLTFSFVGSVGRRSAFLKVYYIYVPLNFCEEILCFEAEMLVLVPFLKLKLLIQCIEHNYLFTNDPKSMFAIVFLSAWGCIYRLKFRNKNTHFRSAITVKLNALE
jgi:hypothetical protein